MAGRATSEELLVILETTFKRFDSMIYRATEGANNSTAMANEGASQANKEVRELHKALRENLAMVTNLQVELAEARKRASILEGELERERARDKQAEVGLKKVEVVDKHLGTLLEGLSEAALAYAMRDARNGAVREAAAKLITKIPAELRQQIARECPEEYSGLYAAMKGAQKLSAPAETHKAPQRGLTTTEKGNREPI